MVEKQIEFTTFKTSIIELDCGWSRKLKFLSQKGVHIMNYRNKHNQKKTAKTAPAKAELCVMTLNDLFYLKEELDKVYRAHTPELEVIITYFTEPQAGLLDDYAFAHVVSFIRSRGFDLWKDEAISSRRDRRVVKLSFYAIPGMFPSWALDQKEE